MKRLIGFCLLVTVALICFLSGAEQLQSSRASAKADLKVNPNRDDPLREYKSFAIVVYAHNAALWCESALRSIFEQNYESYRVLFVDDGSIDNTFETAQQYIIDNEQQHRVIAIRNEEMLGLATSLYRAASYCQDREILVSFNGADWLSHDEALSKLNLLFQNPDVWIVQSRGVDYPTYQQSSSTEPLAFYAVLFKSIPLTELFVDGAFTKCAEAHVAPLQELAGGRIRRAKDPLVVFNRSQPLRSLRGADALLHRPRTQVPYLAQFPTPIASAKGADVILFSYDRPLQLFATLESIQRYFAGIETLTVLYRASDERFEEGYRTVKAAFPRMRYLRQSAQPRKDFKPLLLKAFSESPSEYILFAVDDLIMKDYVDLALCRQMLERTGAYGFFLRMGKHICHSYMFNKPLSVPPSVALSNGIFAWDTKMGEIDWGFPNNLDMTLYRKADLKLLLEESKYKTPNSLEMALGRKAPASCIGLYFERSKLFNLPLNIVNPSDCPHMNFMSTEELLVKFNEGFKIDIDPFYRLENPSPHFECFPEFIPR